MKSFVGVIMILAAMPLAAEEAAELSAILLDRAVKELPIEIAGIGWPEIERLAHEEFAVDAMTISGGADHLAEFASDLHGTVIAEELIASYAENGREATRIPTSGVGRIRVLELDAYRSGSDGYDWAALNEEFPGVKAIVRISRPAVDRLGTYAVVRNEYFTPHGRALASLTKFEKQANGSWESTMAWMGDLW
jgi:hypothetical protein